MKFVRYVVCGILIVLILTSMLFSVGCSLISIDTSSSSATSTALQTATAASSEATQSTPKNTPAALNPITVESTLLYQDDFSDPQSGWETGSAELGIFAYESGEFSEQGLENGHIIWRYAPQANFTDFAVEVDVRTLSYEDGSCWGLLFRTQNTIDNNFYLFEIGNGFFKFDKQINGAWQSLQSAKASDYIALNSPTNKLKVVCLGSQIDLYVNDHLLGSYTDNSITSGGIALDVSHKTHVHFDNLKVYAVSAPVPQAARASYTQAVELHKSGSLAESIQYYEQAIRDYAMYTDAWLGKGEVLSELSQYAEALKCFQNAVQIDPNNVQAWLDEGKCLEALGDKDSAVSCYNQVLKIEANNTEAQSAKALLISAGTADNNSDPPIKQYDSGNLLQVTGPALTVTVNEGELFSTTLGVKNGQPPYTWFLKTDNGITRQIWLSENDTGETLTVNAIALMIDVDSTESKYAFIEVWAEDSSTLTRKGEGSFQVHVINTLRTPSSTPNTSVITSTPSGGDTLDGIWRGLSVVGQPIILLFKNGRIYYVNETWCLNPNDINADSILKDTCQTIDSGFGCRGPLGSGEKYYWEYSLSGDVITVIDKAPQIPLDVPRSMVSNIRYNQKYQWQLEGDTIRTSAQIMNPDFGGDSMTYTRLK